MCHLPRDQQTRKPSSTRKTTSSKRRTTGGTVSLKPSRKTRTKRRKPKYLSLNLKITPDNKNPKSSNKKTKMATHKQKQQLNLFPLHPESNQVQVVDENRSDMQDQDNNVVASFLFDAATDSTTTLNGLLSTATSEESLLSPPPYAYNGGEEGDSSNGNDGLVRTAMRCKERDASEERWVSYSEVIVGKTTKIKEEEVNSCVDGDDRVCAGAWCAKQVQGKKRRLMLALKLDYQQILNAWSDKGPLYIDGDSPQTVPDLHDDNVALMDGWGGGGVGSLWTVPEMTSSDAGDLKANEDVSGGKEGCWKREHREASVLRYKEKRQTRLFSKRIRYEVRKLNAEKRPRMKGRFVKRSTEV